MIYLGNGMYSDAGPSNELMHYGVLGMRWGHRKNTMAVRSGILGDLELELYKRKFKRRTKMMERKHPDLVKAKKDASDARYNYIQSKINEYHSNPSFKKKINKIAKNKFKINDFNPKPGKDDDMLHDMLEEFLYKDKEYTNILNNWSKAYDDYDNVFYKKGHKL